MDGKNNVSLNINFVRAYHMNTHIEKTKIPRPDAVDYLITIADALI